MMDKASFIVETTAIKKPVSSIRYYALFFASGFPALIYQIVWQRALFTIYGVNIQSVTVIVTVFMIGLGLGSLGGGKLSSRPGLNVLRAFGLIEFSIGTFGIFSLLLFHYVARFTAGASTTATALIAFLLLILPTLMMGSTLPLLVEHLVRQTANVGESVGSLYSVNTFGSAVACFVAATFLMRSLGQSGSVRVAAGMNLAVGVTALLLALRSAPSRSETRTAQPIGNTAVRRKMPLTAGLLLAGGTGFIALAYEILWYHIYSFATGGSAFCFPILLGAYLLGIAYGSLSVRDACRQRFQHDLPRTLRGAAIVIFLGSVLAFLVAPATAYFFSIPNFPSEAAFGFVAIAAAFLGAVFPLIAHASIDPDDQAGRKLSYIYLSNIVGSALGSFTIGFVAMDHLSTIAISLILLFAGALMVAVLAVLARPLPIESVLASTAAGTILLALASHLFFSDLFERLMLRSNYPSGHSFRELVENRSGVIAVDQDDVVFGGGVYDGAFRIDPLNDTNNIFRAFAIAAMHPSPRHVLVIGLSSGSWTQVLVNHPLVEEATVVEINPGYLQLIAQRPIVSSLLHNPKVHIVIDDGRRWLVAHPDAKFDFILMNSTFNWRANATNLLSVEFLQLARKHLNTGGTLYYNTTGSARVQFTGATVFPYAMRVANFLAVSDRPIRFDRESWRRILETYSIDGRRVFDLSKPESRSCIDLWVNMPESAQKIDEEHFERSIEYRDSLLAVRRGQRLITDDNMGTEWQ